jgi:hypothetical protein
MSDIILRKCGGCSDTIEINRNNIVDVLYYKNKYYHSKCFCEIAEKRSKAKRSTALEWKSALDSLLDIKADTNKMLKSAWVKDDLNEWLLNNYNVTAVPSRFWQMIADLERGIYKGKKCRPISMEIIFGAWMWGQNKLNKINRINIMGHKGPKNDEARLAYDLAILVNKVPNYLAHKAKLEVLQEEAKKETKINHINYDNMQRTEVKHEGLDDISDLLDEF